MKVLIPSSILFAAPLLWTVEVHKRLLTIVMIGCNAITNISFQKVELSGKVLLMRETILRNAQVPAQLKQPPLCPYTRFLVHSGRGALRGHRLQNYAQQLRDQGIF